MKEYKYTKETGLSVIIRYSKRYHDTLANRRYLIIFRDPEQNRLEALEVYFSSKNYQHLTGLDMVDRNGKIREHCAKEFFDKCTNATITAKDVEIHDRSVFDMKVENLPCVTEFIKIARMAEKYDESRPYLQGDYIIGGIKGCIGIRRNEKEHIYHPCSSLKENILNFSSLKPCQILLILEYNKQEKLFSEIRHVGKGVNPLNLNYPEDIEPKICLKKYKISETTNI
ncbi:MAG: hypothetical protein K6G24_05540 [Lachnospiraceae bacterium]|nr:hypothetical protein [Lachnospiraceae bacterium]